MDALTDSHPQFDQFFGITGSRCKNQIPHNYGDKS